MSLISEALKKARQEAARQDAERPRSPYAVGAADSAERRNGLVPVLAGVGAGCLLAGLILAVAWSAGWGPFARPAQPAVQASQVAAASPAPEPAQPAAKPAVVPPARIEEETPSTPVQNARREPPVRESRPQPTLEARPAAPAETPMTEAPMARPAPTPAAPAPAEVEEVSAPAAAIPAPAPAAPVRPSPAGEASLVEGQTYVGEVPIPGGGALKLNGIAFSQDRPVAVLDGRVMGPGELIQGFTITAIEAGRVRLQGYGTTVFVSPK